MCDFKNLKTGAGQLGSVSLHKESSEKSQQHSGSVGFVVGQSAPPKNGLQQQAESATLHAGGGVLTVVVGGLIVGGTGSRAFEKFK
jgi:hypothetical protein